MSYDIDSKTFNKVFKNRRRAATRFIVPDFQRSYVWRDGQEIEDFWLDIKENYDTCIKNDSRADFHADEKMGLFMGNIILLDKPDANEVLQIIDGQQRITTITIFLIAYRIWLKEYIENLYKIDTAGNFQKSKNQAQSIQTSIDATLHIIDPITKDVIHNRLKPAVNIETVYNNMCRQDWDGKFPDKVDGKGVKPQNKILAPIYRYFRDSIRDLLDKAEENHFCLNKVVSNLGFARVVMSDLNEAYLFFERTNSRGKSLEVGDLLKAHLFGEDPYDSDTTRKIWAKIVNNSNSKLPRLLRYFYIHQKERTTGQKLFNKIKKIKPLDDGTRRENARVLIDDLAEFSEFFNAINNVGFKNESEDDNNIGLHNVLDKLALDTTDRLFHHSRPFNQICRSLEALRYFNFSSHTPLIWSIFKKFYELKMHTKDIYDNVLVELFQNLEKIHFQLRLSKKSGNKVEPIYLDKASEFFRLETEKEFISLLNNLYDELDKQKISNEAFIQYFKELNYDDDFQDIYYIFDRLNEKYSAAQDETSRANIFKPEKKRNRRTDFSIEHWFDQSIAITQEIEEYIEAEVSKHAEIVLKNKYKVKSKDELTGENLTKFESEIKKKEKHASDEAKNGPLGKTPEWCHEIGNLFVIGFVTNSTLPKGPQKKYEFLQEHPNLNTLPYNKAFIKTYIINNSDFSGWNKDEISKRTINIAKDSAELWTFNTPTAKLLLEKI